MSIDFLYLSEQDMVDAGVTDMARCVDAMEETLILVADGDHRMAGASANSHGAQITFPEHPTHEGMPADGPDRRFAAMPAYLGGRFHRAGVRWYGSNVANRDRDLPTAIHMYILSDADTGAPMAVMSANLISAYRTGAVPGVGVKHLAVKDAETISVIGPGVVGRTTVASAVSQRPSLKNLKVKGRSEGSTKRAAEWFENEFPQLTVSVVATDQDAIEGSDIVVTAASTPKGGPGEFPYINCAWLKPGALVLSPAAARIDDDFVTSDDAHLVVDYRGLYDEWFHENGKGVTYNKLLGMPGNHWWDMHDDGILTDADLPNIGDIASGKVPGRTSDDEVFLYSIGGMPVEDVAWASEAYDTAVERGIGTSLNLWDAPRLR